MSGQSQPHRLGRADLAIGLGLIVSIFAVYAQVSHFDFADYDDNVFVYNNVHVQQGLTPATVRWALTAVVGANWVPVTMLSHLVVSQVFGMNAGMHHLVNVLLHMLASVLLYAVLLRATGARSPSAFVAFVFALHPLHTGSVAWVAERKDVLSTVFLFLALYAYVRYTESPSFNRYLPVAGFFALGLMSKPMLITFPFLLLLFDVWPLRRWQWPEVLWEKLQLAALSAGCCLVALFTQRTSIQSIPTFLRIENALVSYVRYIGQMFWPARLALFYPYPHSVALWRAAVSLAIILSVSVVVIRAGRTRPYLAVGWFWYLGTLVPVIGFLQVGAQAHADRYMYIPMIGLLLMLAWGAADLVEKWAGKWPLMKPAMAAVATLSCLACMALAWKETGYWQNSETLYDRSLAVTGSNWEAESYLGAYLVKLPGRCADAADHLEAALRDRPNMPDVNNNLGVCQIEAGLYEAAIAHFEAALRTEPDLVQANNNLGLCLMKVGRGAEAIPYFEAALRVQPDHLKAHRYLGLTLAQIPGREAEAISQLEAAERLAPDPEIEKTLEDLRARKR